LVAKLRTNAAAHPRKAVPQVAAFQESAHRFINDRPPVAIPPLQKARDRPNWALRSAAAEISHKLVFPTKQAANQCQQRGPRTSSTAFSAPETEECQRPITNLTKTAFLTLKTEQCQPRPRQLAPFEWHSLTADTFRYRVPDGIRLTLDDVTLIRTYCRIALLPRRAA